MVLRRSGTCSTTFSTHQPRRGPVGTMHLYSTPGARRLAPDGNSTSRTTGWYRGISDRSSKAAQVRSSGASMTSSTCHCQFWDPAISAKPSASRTTPLSGGSLVGSRTPLPTDCRNLIHEQDNNCCYGNADHTCISAEEQERYGDPARNRSDQCTHDKRFTHRKRELGPKNVLQAKKLAQSPHQREELDRNPHLCPSLSRQSHLCPVANLCHFGRGNRCRNSPPAVPPRTPR